MDLGTWVSTLAVIGGMFALSFALRRELKNDIAEVRAEVGELKAHVVRLDDRLEARLAALDDRLEARVTAIDDRLGARLGTLDDRVYALAVGLKPVIDEAAARAPKG